MDQAGLTDVLGYIAAALTLATFAQKKMLPMRVFAIGANLLFISYGLLGGYYPVALLHIALLPLNVTRLMQSWLPWSSQRDVRRPLTEEWRLRRVS